MVEAANLRRESIDLEALLLDGAVVVLVHGAGGAVCHAGRALAVVAARVQMEHRHVRGTYLYTLFHKLLGGTPDEAVLTVLLSDETVDAVEEFTGDNPSMQP